MSQQSHSGAYNEVLYPSYLATQCSPDHLTAMARLRGLDTAPPERCRMLELGCGDGASLLAYAYAMPGSEFTGIDLAARPIEIGQARAGQLGLRNVHLRCADLMTLSLECGGEFDFIFAHGLFSWVPEPVRERTLAICADLLAPNGVAYFSYNAYPGSYQRDMLRAMLQIHTRHLAEPAEKIKQSLGLIDFVRAAPFRDTPYHKFFDGVYEHRGAAPSEVLLYDELGPVNQPFFFHEFASLAATHGLQFLSEAGFDQTLPALPANVRQALDSLGNDVVTFEQYLDFLTGRAFRQTMLCRAGIKLDHRRRWEPLTGLYLAAPVIAQEAKETDAPGTRRYAGLNGRSAAVAFPGAQAALECLGAAWPAIVPFSELADAAGLGVENADLAILGEQLLRFAEAKLLNVYAHPFRLAATVSDRPRASALARAQLGERFLSNLFCEAVAVTDPLGKLVFERLDGNHTASDVAAELDAILSAQKPASEAGQRQIATARAHLTEALRKQLHDICHLGLLEA